MSATMPANGQVRKSLAAQLDRLDGILDGLADALNEAVAAAVREAVVQAVKDAVQAAVREVLQHPELVARRQAPVPPPALPWRTRLRQRLAACTDAVRASGGLLRRALGGLRRRLDAGGRHAVTRLAGAARTATAGLRFAYRLRYPLLLGILAGLTAGTVAHAAGPWLAAAVGGGWGFRQALRITVGRRRRRAVSTEPA
jgi:hypothetical protein